MPRTYLDLDAHVAERIDPYRVRQWIGDAKRGSADESALADVWLGERELGRCEDPVAARQYFAAALLKKRATGMIRSLARFDDALALARQGMEIEALSDLRSLKPQGLIDKTRVSLLTRSVKLRKAIKDRNLAEGLPEPSDRLDPLCGQKSLSTCLSKLFNTAVKVGNSCRVTGLGSNLRDLKVACDKLNVTSFLVKADKEAFQRLPKPLVAFVDHDHFVAVLDSDRNGVDLSCSECAGGAVRRINWSQWKEFEASAYLVPVREGSAAQQAISFALQSKESHGFPHKRLRRGLLSLKNVGSLSLLDEDSAAYLSCSGYTLASLPKDQGSNGLHGDPINLAYLTNTVGPETDLTVKNPTGPSVDWGRRYSSIYNAADSTGIRNVQDLYNFGYNWTTPYSIFVVDASPVVVTQAPEGVATNLPAQGTGAVDPGYTWELYLNGTKVQDNTSPGGWSITLSYFNATITPPTSLTSTVGYKLVWTFSGDNNFTVFDALPGNSVRQGMTGDVVISGTDSPGTGLTWDILKAGATIATSAAPSGWGVSSIPYGGGQAAVVTAPITATIATTTKSGLRVRESTIPTRFPF